MHQLRVLCMLGWLTVACTPTTQTSSTAEALRAIELPRGREIARWSPHVMTSPVWIGTGAACENVPGQGGIWQASQIMLFGGRLQCSYIWIADGQTFQDIDALKQKVPDIQSDPPVVVTLGADLKQWSKQQYELTRSLLDFPRTRASVPTGPPRVRVAVLDAADGPLETAIDVTRHGRAVGAVINELACEKVGSNCSAEIRNYPVLTLSTNAAGNIQVANTGSFGTLSGLARQIERASEEWLNDRAAGGPNNLIINLSVGASTCFGDARELSRQTNEGYQQLRRAIGRATCRGALVVAAAGNRDVVEGCPSFAPVRTGRHMVPGVWGGDELRAADCVDQLEVASPAFGGSSPLLLGISALDNADKLLLTAANGSDLAAYGQTVVVPAPRSAAGSAYSTAFSGTSMSAAAVSGIAAAIWTYQPGLPREKLIELLRNSGTPLPAAGTGEEFVCNVPSQGCGTVQRVSFCQALKHASVAVTCNTLVSGPPGFKGIKLGTGIPQETAGTCPTCGRCVWPPPAAEDFDARDVPWVQPQPNNGCGTCGNNKGELHLLPRREQGREPTPEPQRLAQALTAAPKAASAPPRFELQAQFPKEAKCAWLRLQSPLGDQHLSLGEMPRTAKGWLLPTSAGTATAASVIYTRPALGGGPTDVYYDESSVQIYAPVTPPTP